MDEFPKSMVIKSQINSNFYNNVILKSNYVLGYFNHDKGQGTGCKTETKIDETAMEISCSAWVFGDWWHELQSSWMCHCPPKTWCDCCQQSHWRYVYMSICCVVYCHVCSIGHAHLPYCRQGFATWAFPRVGSCTWKHKFHCRTEKEEKRKRIHVGTFSLLSVMFCNMSISRVEGCTWKHEFHCRREEEEKRNNISQAQIIPILICLEQKLVFCASENKTGFLCSGNKTGFLCFWERLQAPQTDRQTDRDLMKELQVLSSPSLPCCVILQQKVPWN